MLAADAPRGGDTQHQLLARITDQCGQAACGAVATMRSCNGAHAVGCRLIIKQNAIPAIDLKINESRRDKSLRRQLRLWPVDGDFSPRRKTDHAPVSNQKRCVPVPRPTIKNAVCQNGLVG